MVPKSRYIDFLASLESANLEFKIEIRQGKLHEFLDIFSVGIQFFVIQMNSL